MKNILIAASLGFMCVSSAGPARAAEGQLDKELIRRVVRAHLQEIRYCYNQALARDPEASGSVVIDFTIGVEGKVTHTALAASDMKDAAVPECMRAAIGGWLFPKPEGGTVEVSYPFVLEPG